MSFFKNTCITYAGAAAFITITHSLLRITFITWNQNCNYSLCFKDKYFNIYPKTFIQQLKLQYLHWRLRVRTARCPADWTRWAQAIHSTKNPSQGGSVLESTWRKTTLSICLRWTSSGISPLPPAEVHPALQYRLFSVITDPKRLQGSGHVGEGIERVAAAAVHGNEPLPASAQVHYPSLRQQLRTDFLLLYFSILGLCEVMCVTQNVSNNYTIAVECLNTLLSLELSEHELIGLRELYAVWRKFWAVLHWVRDLLPHHVDNIAVAVFFSPLLMDMRIVYSKQPYVHIWVVIVRCNYMPKRCRDKAAPVATLSLDGLKEQAAVFCSADF